MDDEDRASSGTVEPCPLALQSFPTLDVKDCCPAYSKLTSINDNHNDDNNKPTKNDLQDLQRELELMVQSTTYRIKRITEEYQKADAYVKQHRDNASSTQMTASSSGSSSNVIASGAPVIKLDLKKLKSELGGGAVGGDDSKSKRRRKRANAPAFTDQSESDYEKASVTGRPSSQFKKRQRQDSNASSVSQDMIATIPAASAEMLQDMPVMGDNMKSSLPKPSQQIPTTTFWNYVDAFFKNITENDLEVLETDIDRDSPEAYLFPPIGRPYQQVWVEEDKSFMAHQPHGAATSEKKGRRVVREDDSGIGADLYCGPLTERLLAALQEEDIIYDGIYDDESEEESTFKKSKSSKKSAPKDINREEVYCIEQRIRTELKFLGLLNNNTTPTEFIDDNDEVSLELKRLQNELRKVSVINLDRKDIVYERAIDEMGYQEYRNVLDELDKQVEQAFVRRQRLASKKKRKGPLMTVPDGLQLLLDKRRKLIQEFAPIFPPEIIGVPSYSIFDDEADGEIKSVSLAPQPMPAVIPVISANSANPEPIHIDLTSKGGETSTIIDMSSSTTGAGSKQRKPSKKKQVSAEVRAEQAAPEVVGDEPGESKKPRKPRQPRKKKVPAVDLTDTNMSLLEGISPQILQE